MRNVTRSHDVVAVSDPRLRFRLRTARDGVMLANFVSLPDEQVTSFASKYLVQRIRTEHRTGRYFILGTHCRPALHIHIGLQQTARSHDGIWLHDTELADFAVRPDHCFGMYARSRCNVSRR